MQHPVALTRRWKSVSTVPGVAAARRMSLRQLFAPVHIPTRRQVGKNITFRGRWVNEVKEDEKVGLQLGTPGSSPAKIGSQAGAWRTR
ncbi:MAG: hypothetical protein ACM3MK_09320 [Chitinophagales bacterium]